jgi:hypothetical protein
MKLRQKLNTIFAKEYANAYIRDILLFIYGSVSRNQKKLVVVMMVAHCTIENKGDANWTTFDRSLQ